MCTLSRRSVAGQGENRALSNEVHGRSVFVQVSEYRSERLARVQFLRGLRILGVHVNDEVRVRRKKSHLTFGITAISAVRVGFDELSCAHNSSPFPSVLGRHRQP